MDEVKNDKLFEAQGEAFQVLDRPSSFRGHLLVAAFQSTFHYFVFWWSTIFATPNLELRRADPRTKDVKQTISRA